MPAVDGETKKFVASRLTTGNRIFPTEITVSPVQVRKSKRSWFSSDEESISLRHVSSVRIKTGLMFSDIWIESSGGANRKVFCLAEAPNAEAAIAVHREAHGLVADHVYEVVEGS